MKFEVEPRILFIQLGVFVGLMIALKVLYFDPILKLLKRREALTSGRQAEAEGFEASIRELREKYQIEMNRVRDEMSQKRQLALQKARTSVEDKIQKAKASLEKQIEDHSNELQKELHQFKEQIPRAAADVAHQMVESILTSKVVRL